VVQIAVTASAQCQFAVRSIQIKRRRWLSTSCL